MCEMDENMRIKRYDRIDTSSFPDKELWEFVGLEDARIVRWNGKLYICGVRRDLDTIGTGRMELSEIEITESGVKELKQYRIPAPNGDSSYCEKNWMPILGRRFGSCSPRDGYGPRPRSVAWRHRDSPRFHLGS